MTDHSENKSNQIFFSFSFVPEAFSINSEPVLWKFNFMGDSDADGILVSGQLEIGYFSNKSVFKWHPDLSLSTVCYCVLLQATASL